MNATNSIQKPDLFVDVIGVKEYRNKGAFTFSGLSICGQTIRCFMSGWRTPMNDPDVEYACSHRVALAEISPNDIFGCSGRGSL